jgi:peptidoglycan LD-endopeptidase CwlK
MPSRSLKDLNNILVSAWEKAEIEFENQSKSNSNVIITCTYRSIEEQNQLYAIGRTVKGNKVTNAKGGQSEHNNYPSTAFDIGFIGLDKKLHYKEEDLRLFADIIKKIEPRIEWGGDWKNFKDKPHFQLKKQI